jgi:pimeloyl-ACP methyl ester carboxylesterase
MMKIFTAATALVSLAISPAYAQQVADVTQPRTPLVLKNRGSLIIGGERIAQTPAQLSSIIAKPPAEAGHVTVNQMYVEFMVPQVASAPPVIMTHGATLTGKSYDTTPDGRMGWYEYFVRRGLPTYVVDQASRARSGVDISVYNDVRAGSRPASDLPNTFRISQEDGLAQFRIGIRNGAPFADTQFPVKALAALAAQSVPDFNAALPQPNPSYAALANLGAQLGGAVVMGHSQGGLFPLHAALANPAGVKQMVLIEPGTCHETAWTPAQMAVFRSKPILVVFGDHLDAAVTVPGFSWRTAYEDCRTFVAEVNAAGGNATMLHLPAAGLEGNSHLLMMERNNLQIADLLIGWIKKGR